MCSSLALRISLHTVSARQFHHMHHGTTLTHRHHSLAPLESRLCGRTGPALLTFWALEGICCCQIAGPASSPARQLLKSQLVSGAHLLRVFPRMMSRSSLSRFSLQKVSATVPARLVSQQQQSERKGRTAAANMEACS
jgi:hypothetical protein